MHPLTLEDYARQLAHYVFQYTRGNGKVTSSFFYLPHSLIKRLISLVIRSSYVCKPSLKILRIVYHEIESICNILNMNPRNVLSSTIKLFCSELGRKSNKGENAIRVTKNMPNSCNHGTRPIFMSQLL